MKGRIVIYFVSSFLLLFSVQVNYLEGHKENLVARTRTAGDPVGKHSLDKSEVIFYTGFEPGDPLGTEVDYKAAGSPDEWHVTTEMLYHGTTSWMTAPVGDYFCHIGDDSSGYSDGNEVGYQFNMDLSDYSEAYLSYLSAMQAYQNTYFDRFILWGWHEGLTDSLINLDPGGGFAWGGDWGMLWFLPEQDSISLWKLVGHSDVTIEFWFWANSGSPEGFGFAFDELIVWGTPIPTAIVLSSFDAIPGPGRILLEWTTETERDNLGFHLLRRNSPEEAFSQLNEDLIHAASGGNSEYPLHYQFVDPNVVDGVRYEYQLVSVNFKGEKTEHGSVYATAATLNSYPISFQLHQNHPNPFNASTKIRYRIPKAGHVSLKIFNTLGQEVRNLVDGWQKAGEYGVMWDGRDTGGREVASGLYFCRLTVGEIGRTVKMVLIK